jgi:Fic family protein
VPQRPHDVEEVCNYISALRYARSQLSRPNGLPLATRLLCESHRRLMSGTRGSEKNPGELRRSQNWIGGTRPGNAHFVPPPHDIVPESLSQLERWIHKPDALPPLVRAGMAHVQFETIHPFPDGNGRIGRLLIALLLEHWALLDARLLYISVAFKRHRAEYYEKLSAVRTSGDWEGWNRFFLACVREAADDGVAASKRLFAVLTTDRARLVEVPSVTVPAIRLFDRLPAHPLVTLPLAAKLINSSTPTAAKAITVLQKAGVLRETTGRIRKRTYAYEKYLRVLTEDTALE